MSSSFAIYTQQIIVLLESVYKKQNPGDNYIVVYIDNDRMEERGNRYEETGDRYEGRYQSYKSFDDLCLDAAYILGLNEYVIFSIEMGRESGDLIGDISYSRLQRSATNGYELQIYNPRLFYKSYIMTSSVDVAAKLQNCLIEMAIKSRTQTVEESRTQTVEESRPLPIPLSLPMPPVTGNTNV